MDERHVLKHFYKSLAVGFKKDTIRLMLAPLIKKGDLDDDDLMKEVNDAVDADEENREKTKGSKSAVSNNLNADAIASDNSSVDNAVLLRELRALSGTVKELSALKDSVQLLEGRVNSLSQVNANAGGLFPNNSGGNVGGNGGNIASGGTHHNNSVVKNWIKCAECNKNNVPFCDHCNYCGRLGHKRKDCDQLPPKNV